MAQKLEELLIWTKALELWDAVNPLLDRPGFRRNWDLHNEIADALDSVVSNIPEGFEQPTDRAFARYLYISKGSAAEVTARLLLAQKRNIIDGAQYGPCAELSTSLQKMLGGFIKYLYKSDRKDRGAGKAYVKIPKTRRRRPPKPETDEPPTSD